MGHRPSSQFLHNISYAKTSAEIKVKAEEKIAKLKLKIVERETRMHRIRKEYDITDSDLITLMAQAAKAATSNMLLPNSAYNLSTSPTGDPRVIGAGVVQNLLTEQGLIEDEKSSIERLTLICRNIRPIVQYAADTGAEYASDSFHMSLDDLEFLGF